MPLKQRKRKSVIMDDDIYFCPRSWAAVDTETTGTKRHRGCKPFIVSITDHRNYRFLWEVGVDPLTRQPKWTPKLIAKIQQVLERYELLVFHHAKFDITMLLEIGIDIRHKPFWDTQLASHLKSSSEPHYLKDQAILHLDMLDDDQDELIKCVHAAARYGRKQKWMVGKETKANYWLPKEVAIHAKYAKGHVFYTAATKYANQDTYRTALLYLLQRGNNRIKESFHLLKREFDLVNVVRKMERFGIHISRKRLARSIDRYEGMQHEAEETCKRLAKNPDLNVRSNPQLNELLFKKWGLPANRTTKTGFSTDAKTIRWLIQTIDSSLPEKKDRLPFLQSLAKYSRTKASVGYNKDYRTENVNGVLHCSFNQMGAQATTRFSASDPNPMNVGKGKELEDDFGERLKDEEGNDVVDFVLREPFGPRAGRVWYDFDYDQLQMRIFAVAADDKELIKAFDEGWDAHDFTAMRMFGTSKISKLQRRAAKAVNFGCIFGAGVEKTNLNAGIPDAYERFHSKITSVRRFMDATIRDVRKNGFVRTLSGYPLDVPYRTPYVGVCYIVQGTEGDIAKYALLEVDAINDKPKYTDFDPHITNFVHDSIVDDCHDSPIELVKPLLRDIQRGMERSGLKVGVKTPASCEIVRKSWDKGEKLVL